VALKSESRSVRPVSIITNFNSQVKFNFGMNLVTTQTIS